MAVQCTSHALPGARACVLGDVVLWSGKLWLLAQGAQRARPVAGAGATLSSPTSPAGELRLPAVRITTFDTVEFKDEDTGLRVGLDACSAPRAASRTSSRGPCAQEYADVAQLSSPPFNASAVQDTIDSAVLYRRTHVQNWCGPRLHGAAGHVHRALA